MVKRRILTVIHNKQIKNYDKNNKRKWTIFYRNNISVE